MDEFELIRRYFAPLAPSGPDVIRGIGDDCAVVRGPADADLAVSIDTLVEDVHFPRETEAADVGWKALAAGLSDLAAAGAEPAWCMLALSLPAGDEPWVAGFAHGFAELAAIHGVALVGGDITRAAETSVTVQAAGHVPRAGGLGRGGARAGDAIYVSGWPGEAAAGLVQLLERGPEADATLLARLNRPQPRTELGRSLHGIATACIDVSDGLAGDLAHIAAASGVGAVIDTARLPVSARIAAAADPETVRGWVLGGGDDYELCFCAPRGARDRIGAIGDHLGLAVHRIGEIVPGQGVALRQPDGRLEPVTATGYRHFAADGNR